MPVDYRTLHNLHAAAVAQFEYCADTVAFGQAEYWIAPSEIREQLAKHGALLGDCDDFAALAVMFARGQGMPARFVFCETEIGEGHLVAEIDGWIIDNRQPDVMRRDDLPYVWQVISGYAPGDPWHVVLPD